jgi:hypothetical protein
VRPTIQILFTAEHRLETQRAHPCAKTNCVAPTVAARPPHPRFPSAPTVLPQIRCQRHPYPLQPRTEAKSSFPLPRLFSSPPGLHCRWPMCFGCRYKRGPHPKLAPWPSPSPPLNHPSHYSALPALCRAPHHRASTTPLVATSPPVYGRRGKHQCRSPPPPRAGLHLNPTLVTAWIFYTRVTICLIPRRRPIVTDRPQSSSFPATTSLNTASTPWCSPTLPPNPSASCPSHHRWHTFPISRHRH